MTIKICSDVWFLLQQKIRCTMFLPLFEHRWSEEMASQSSNYKKPTSDRKHEKKERKCLMCSAKFTSSHYGERVCQSCKSTSAWRDSSLAAWRRSSPRICIAWVLVTFVAFTTRGHLAFRVFDDAVILSCKRIRCVVNSFVVTGEYWMLWLLGKPLGAMPSKQRSQKFQHRRRTALFCQWCTQA